MKKIFLFSLLVIIGANCFSQEPVVTTIARDGTVPWEFEPSGWPRGHVGTQWNNLISRLNLVQLIDDPFNPNELHRRIGRAAFNATSGVEYWGVYAYTVYLTMGNRRFVVFLFNTSGRQHWIFEVR